MFELVQPTLFFILLPLTEGSQLCSAKNSARREKSQDTEREDFKTILKMLSPAVPRSFCGLLKAYLCELIQFDLFGYFS